MLLAAVKSPYCRSRKPFEIRAGAGAAGAGNERESEEEAGTTKIEIVSNLLSPGNAASPRIQKSRVKF